MAGVKNKNEQAKRSAYKDLNKAKEECLKEFDEDGELPFYQKTTGKGKDG